MATIQRPVKTYGTRRYTDEVAAAPSNQDPILASEVDGDLDGIYAAWNAGVDTVNIKSGAVMAANLGIDCNGPWKVSGTTITPNDTTKTVAAASGAAGAVAFMLGSTAVKTRLRDVGASGVQILCNADGQTGLDDTTKASWYLSINPNNDVIDTYRAAANSTAFAIKSRLDGTGNLSLYGSQINLGATVGATAGALMLASGGTAVRGLLQSYAYGGSTITEVISNHTQVVAAKPIWTLRLDAGGSIDAAQFLRTAPSGGAQSEVFKVDPGGIIVGTAVRCAGVRCSGGGGSVSGDGYSNQIGFGWNGANISARVDNVSPGYFLTVTSASDERLKQNIAEDVPGLDAVCAMRPITFEYVPEYLPPPADERTVPALRRYGMIAQEMQSLAPCAVHDDGSDDHYLSIDYQTLVPLLVNAVKELAARLTALEAR